MSRGLWFVMSARTRRSLTLLWTALFLCSLVTQYASLASPTPVLAAHDERLFELEGNAEDGAADGDDWDSVNNAADDIFISEAGSDVTYFKGGGSKPAEKKSEEPAAASPAPAACGTGCGCH